MFKKIIGKIKKGFNSGKAVVLLGELIADHGELRECYVNLGDMGQRKIVLLENMIRENARGEYMNYEYYYSMKSAVRTINLKKSDLYLIEECFKVSISIKEAKLTKLGYRDKF
jgi:hypothetical protein